MSRRLGVALLPLLLLASACGTAEPDPRPEPGPLTAFADCAALTAPLSAPSAAGRPLADVPLPASTAAGRPLADVRASPTAGGQARPLPELTLPCFAGGANVAVGALRGPAVINLWASWCPPCRKELPAFQRLADRSAGKVRVVGVNSGDRRDAAQSIGEDFGLRFPTLLDLDEDLLHTLERRFLPITLFVDAQGRIQHQDESGALDDEALAGLVKRHLGVAVPS